MSTHVHTAHPEFHSGTYLSLDAYRSEVVNVGIGSGPEGGVRSAGINVPRADLLAAISSELGVVIIDQADMPIVTERGVPDAVFVGDTPWHRGTGWDVAAIRKSALDRLALADYLERNPPVDEAQVSALADIVRTATDTPLNAYIGADLTAEGIARSLIATGKVEVRS